MTQTEQKKAAKKFSEEWKDRGYEKGESQKFWIDLLCNVFGVKDFTNFISFEDKVRLDHTSFIDGEIPSTKVMIEQKSIDKDLRSPIKQSDGTLLNPFQQAKRYITELPVSKHPRWVVTCNFKSFLVYDMEQPNGEPEEILLENLEQEYYRLSFLADTGDVHLKKELEVSKKAGDIIGEIYDAILAQYNDGDNPSAETLKSLNMLCVRLVFCLYAEDAGIFGKKSMFGDYIRQFSAKELRRALLELFKVLDQKPEEREKYLEDDLAAFPYVNGGLFTEADMTIPHLTDEIKDLLVGRASENFNWAEISPTIFGAIFESTLNPETRRAGGMHYTSIENIHKVIDPLFLDDLIEEFEQIKEIKTATIRTDKLMRFHTKLGQLKFLDPACGSGNFLTETYLSLRRLENKCIQEMLGGGEVQTDLFGYSLIKVHIQQFYGIEINDFACVVAKTALWIAECQMMQETSAITNSAMDFLPLDNYTNITEGNALRIDWETVVPKNELNYIMGNPPFVGKKEQSENQKSDLIKLFPNKMKGFGNLDYVSGWYVKALNLIKNTEIKCAFVSTNSITQGEQVPILWKYLLSEHLCINFAYKTFRWDSEANLKAHVHCVIIGFSDSKVTVKNKILYLNENQKCYAENINPYLISGKNIFIENRSKSICNVPEINYGSMPIDDGHLILDENDVNLLIKENENNKKFIRQYAGGVELLRNKKRWCLWLQNASPKELIKSKIITSRVAATKAFRQKSNRPQTLKLADTPTLFGEIRQPDSNMLVIPKVSSETRRYIPISFISPEVIINGSALIVPNANLYSFGILTSNVHNAWMRVVAGRMKSDYQYSGTIVYNNFPWPEPTEEQKKKISETAQNILDVRASFPDCSLADLYDETLMPPALRKAHQENDKAVMKAYGFSIKMTESECVAQLFKLYEKLVNK